MALTGLDIFKLLPKKNCKECEQPTCLAFAMALANAKTSLDKCPLRFGRRQGNPGRSSRPSHQAGEGRHPGRRARDGR